MDLSNIKAFVFDVDGVLTDGAVHVDSNGEFYRSFNEKDLFALRMAAMNSFILGIITGGSASCISAGLAKCGIKQEDIYKKSRDKIKDFNTFCQMHGLNHNEVMYFGDDVPDVEVLNFCGAGVCPADACDEAKQVSQIIATKAGGKGCVRELIETTLRVQHKWIFDKKIYSAMF